MYSTEILDYERFLVILSISKGLPAQGAPSPRQATCPVRNKVEGAFWKAKGGPMSGQEVSLTVRTGRSSPPQGYIFYR